MFGKSILLLSFILRKKLKEMEDNKDKDNRNNNKINQPIRKPIESQHQIVSSSTTTTSTSAHRQAQRNKNKKYNNNDKNRKGNNNNRYSQKQQIYYYQNNIKISSKYVKTFDPVIPCKLIDFVGGVNYIPSSDNGVIFNRVVEFFRKLTTEIEQEKKILDFNFHLQEDQEGFYVKIHQPDPTRHPPYKTLNCLSCDTESETNKISKLSYPTTTREEVSIHHNLWTDAKARPMFIVTPKRHIERLSECNDQEIFSMFLLAIQIIEQETRLSNAKWNNVRFLKMTLNHGNARNVEHLHLKIKVSRNDLNHFKNCWDEKRKESFKILEDGLYKKDERLTKIIS